jgi:predicted lipoprotein with Yx(FWY)xxD motif
MEGTLRSVFRLTLAFAFLAMLVPLALAAPANVGETAKGKVLVNDKGMTLYTFAKDANGQSACNGPCAQNWPPLMATGGTASGDWTIITRTDGAKQWAYKGHPLYAWKGDQKPGDTTGDGFANGAWHVAKP